MFLLFLAFASTVCAWPISKQEAHRSIPREFILNLELAKLQLGDSTGITADDSASYPFMDLAVRRSTEQDVTTSFLSDGQLSPRRSVREILNSRSQRTLKAPVSATDFTSAPKAWYPEQQKQNIRLGLKVYLENEAWKLLKLHDSIPKNPKARNENLKKELASLQVFLNFRLVNKEMNRLVEGILGTERMARVVRELYTPRKALALFLVHMCDKKLSTTQEHLKRVDILHKTQKLMSQAQVDNEAARPAAMVRGSKLRDFYEEYGRKVKMAKMAETGKKLMQLEAAYCTNRDAIRGLRDDLWRIEEVFARLEVAGPTAQSLIKQANTISSQSTMSHDYDHHNRLRPLNQSTKDIVRDEKQPASQKSGDNPIGIRLELAKLLRKESRNH